MLQNPTKYHTNALTHFLSLHNSSTQCGLGLNASNVINGNSLSLSGHDHNLNTNGYDLCEVSNNNEYNISENSIGPSDGKSFTIAAILGLNSNGNNGNRHFDNVVNLSFHQAQTKLLGNMNRGGQSYNANLTVGSVQSNKQFSQHYSIHSPVSAIQNLQQLHQHHVNSSSSFVNRDKYKQGRFLLLPKFTYSSHIQDQLYMHCVF